MKVELPGLETDEAIKTWNKKRHRDYSREWRKRRKESEVRTKKVRAFRKMLFQLIPSQELYELRLMRQVVDDSGSLVSHHSLDSSYPFLLVNKCYERVFGQSTSSFNGKPLHIIIHPADTERVIQSIRHVRTISSIVAE